MEPTQQPATQPNGQQFVAPSPAPLPPPRARKFPAILVIIVVAAVLILIAMLVTNHKSSTNQTVSNNTSTVLPSAQVIITSSGFSPATIKVAKGQTVTWINRDTNPHQPASDPYPAENALPGFVDDTALATGESYGFKFNQAGTFTYHDHLNPLQLKGTVIVK